MPTKIKLDPNAPSGRGSVLSQIHNKNNKENLRLSRKIVDYDKEMHFVIKELDFEKLDLYEFLRRVRTCESDKVEEYIGWQDEIRKTFRGVSHSPVDLQRGLTEMTIGGESVCLSDVLKHRKRPIKTADPRYTTPGDLQAASCLPPTLLKKRAQTTIGIDSRMQHSRPSPIKRQRSVASRAKQKPEAGKDTTGRDRLAVPAPSDNDTVVPRAHGKAVSPRHHDNAGADQAVSILITDSDKGRSSSVTASQEQDLPSSRHVPTQGKCPASRKPKRANDAVGSRDSKKRASLDRSDALLTKTASLFANRAKFYNVDDSDSSDLTLGLQNRQYLTTDATHIQEESNSEGGSTKMEMRSVVNDRSNPMTPNKPVLHHTPSFYDMVVRMNRESGPSTHTLQRADFMKRGSSNPKSQLRGSYGPEERATNEKITLPVLLSMGIGELQPRRHLYDTARTTSNTRRVFGRDGAQTAHVMTPGLRHPQATVLDSDDLDYYSDSSYYDSESSYDMRLLAHRKEQKRMRYKPLKERIQYLYTDLQFFCNPKPKSNILTV